MTNKNLEKHIKSPKGAERTILHILDMVINTVSALMTVPLNNKKPGDRIAHFSKKMFNEDYNWYPGVDTERKRYLRAVQSRGWVEDFYDSKTMRNIKLGAKSVYLGLAYLGARALLGADIHEVLHTDINDMSPIMGIDALAYTLPMIIPLTRAYFQSPHNPHDLNSIRNNPEVGMRI